MNNEEKILAILEKQGEMLEKHGEMLEKHGEMLARIDKRLGTLEEGQARLEVDVSGIKVRLDMDIQRQLNLLAEGQEEILTRMPSEEDMDIINGRLDTLEAVVKKHSKEIAELKKAQ